MEHFTHTLIVRAVWYSKLDTFKIVKGVKPLKHEIRGGNDVVYDYEVPITLAEKKLLERLDVKEIHSKYHYETALVVLDWCYARAKQIEQDAKVTFKENDK